MRMINNEKQHPAYYVSGVILSLLCLNPLVLRATYDKGIVVIMIIIILILQLRSLRRRGV